MQKVYDCIAYSTKKCTWVNSGVTPSQISLSLYRPDNVLISSMAATSSGDGRYYGLLYHDPTSAGGRWVMQKWIAVINGNTYITTQFGKIITMNVGSP